MYLFFLVLFAGYWPLVATLHAVTRVISYKAFLFLSTLKEKQMSQAYKSISEVKNRGCFPEIFELTPFIDIFL